MRIHIQISKEWFEKNKSILAKAYDLEVKDYAPEESGKGYLIGFNDLENSEYLVDDEGRIQITSNCDELPLISITDYPENSALLNLAQLAAKHYNKIKTTFEALK